MAQSTHKAAAAVKSKSRPMDAQLTPTTSAAAVANKGEQVWFKYELRESIANYLAQMGIGRELLEQPPLLAYFDQAHQAIRGICALSNVKIVSPASAGDSLDDTLLASPPEIFMSSVVVTKRSSGPRRSRSRRRATTEAPSPGPTTKADG